MQLAQLYYVEREFCCGVLTAFLGFFVAEGLFDSFPLEDFAETCLRLRSFETTSLFLDPSQSSIFCSKISEKFANVLAISAKNVFACD